MSEVRLIPLGVGDAFSSRFYTTGFALGVDDSWLLIDCSHPIRKMLREASTAAGFPIDIDQVEGAAITHLHADHCSGLEDLGYYSYFVLGRRARIAMHPRISARLWDGFLAAGMDSIQLERDGPTHSRNLEEYFDLTALDTEASVQVGPFAIECRFTIHPIPTTAFRIQTAGRTLGFSADSAFDPELIEWLSPADLIVHEATHLPESKVHTPYERLITLPPSLRSKMRLTHFSDDFDLNASLIEPLRQGVLYRV